MKGEEEIGADDSCDEARGIEDGLERGWGGGGGLVFFFFQAEDGIRDYKVTGVQTCALPIYLRIWHIYYTQKALLRQG